MNDSIDVDVVHKSFGRVTALDGVSLRVRAGTVTGLLGHNGAGKTTLIRILATLVRPDRGRARVGGYDVADHPVAVRRLIGLAGQHAAIDPALTGRENLDLIARLYRVPRRLVRPRIEEVLERLSLTGDADRPVRGYSGGMRRRLDLGASLVGAPAVLLLDEPSTGLDPAARLELWALVREMAAGGTGVLLTTQQLEEADNLATDIAVLSHGQVVARGTPADLKARLGGNAVTVTVTDRAEIGRAASVLRPLSGSEPTIDAVAASVTVHTGEGALARVVRMLDDARIELADVTAVAPSLEDVYLSLTTTPVGVR